MWMQLSDEFVKYPVDFLAYELLNEAVANDPDDWNKLLNITINSLRKLEPYRKIIIGSNRWQSPDTFDELKIPENDRNIILSFHFYTPFIFTHYRTHWTDIGEYVGTVRYPGQVINPKYLINYEGNLVEKLQGYTKVFNKDSLLKNILEPIEYARKHGLQLYCGEFGCTPNVYRSDRLQWYSDVCEIFRENNIAWANWDYKGAFAIFNLQNGNPDETLIDILMGSSD
jgi:endoglucanase